MEYGNLISLNLSHNSLIQGDNTKLSNEVNAIPLVNTLPRIQKQKTKKGQKQTTSNGQAGPQEKKSTNTLKGGRTTLKIDRSSQRSLGVRSSKSIRSRPGSAVRGEQASLEEEFMLAIQSGNIAPPNLDLIGKALTN